MNVILLAAAMAVAGYQAGSPRPYAARTSHCTLLERMPVVRVDSTKFDRMPIARPDTARLERMPVVKPKCVEARAVDSTSMLFRSATALPPRR